MELKWYAVYTRPRWEKKVAETLSLLEIENYCPLNKVLRQWSDRKKIVYEPLFTSYVFVRINEKQYEQVRRVDGILNFVYWQGKPGVIKDKEINLIIRFLNDYERVKIEKIAIDVDDIVKVTDGPFMEHEGRVVGVKSNTISVMLPCLGFLLTAEATNIEKVF